MNWEKFKGAFQPIRVINSPLGRESKYDYLFQRSNGMGIANFSSEMLIEFISSVRPKNVWTVVRPDGAPPGNLMIVSGIRPDGLGYLVTAVGLPDDAGAGDIFF